MLGNYRILDDDPQEQSAINDITRTKGLVDAEIERSHFPKEWTIKSAEEYLETRAAEAAVRVGAADVNANASAGAQGGDAGEQSSTSEPRTRRVEYPWPTRRTRDGAVIVGIRRRGDGHQVCFEVTESDGRVVRKLKPGSEVGFSSVAQYGKMRGWNSRQSVAVDV